MTTDKLARQDAPAVVPLSASTVLDTYFLEARCRLLDLAAILDRIDRGDGGDALVADPRRVRIQRALDLLHDRDADRAEAVQKLFSLDYDPSWQRPQPR